MLRAIIISPNEELTRQLDVALGEVRGVGVARVLDKYPDEFEINRVVRAAAPQIAFLSMASGVEGARVATTLERIAPGIQIIGIHHNCDSGLLLEVMRLGIREFLSAPFETEDVRQCLLRAGENLRKRPVGIESTDLVFAFLPSKAGVGTTTLALNTAVALSKIEPGQTLIVDFDLNSGLLQFMLKLENPHSVIEAAEHSTQMDENLWPRLVTRVGDLDVLHAGRMQPQHRMEVFQVRNLVEFLRRNYRIIIFDLSGNLERYSMEMMQEAKKIFLVCTPELPSLHLAREKHEYLHSYDLSDRISVLLNRCIRKAPITADEIQDTLGLPVYMTFPNDYAGVHKALVQGRPIAAESPLSARCEELGYALLEREMPVPDAKRRFVEYFSIGSARLSQRRLRAEM